MIKKPRPPPLISLLFSQSKQPKQPKEFKMNEITLESLVGTAGDQTIDALCQKLFETKQNENSDSHIPLNTPQNA